MDTARRRALRLDTPAGERVGAGGVFSTVRDLVKWDENFYTGRIGGRALIEDVQTPGKLNDGKPLTYAWGLQVGRIVASRSSSMADRSAAIART